MFCEVSVVVTAAVKHDAVAPETTDKQPSSDAGPRTQDAKEADIATLHAIDTPMRSHRNREMRCVEPWPKQRGHHDATGPR